MILPCNCSHESQDRFHGKGRRVHNITKKHTGRCTVCGNEKALTAQQIKDSKEE